MKFSLEVSIAAGTDVIWRAFDDTSNLRRWRRGLESVACQSGEPNQEGSVNELQYDNQRGGRRVLETVTERREGSFLAMTIVSDHYTALTVNLFAPAGANHTRWTLWCNCQFRGIRRAFALMHGAKFRTETEDDMQRFCLMVESDVAEKRI